MHADNKIIHTEREKLFCSTTHGLFLIPYTLLKLKLLSAFRNSKYLITAWKQDRTVLLKVLEIRSSVYYTFFICPESPLGYLFSPPSISGLPLFFTATDTLLCHCCLQLTNLPVSLSHTELSKWSSMSSCCPVSQWSAWPWFHFTQERAHWKQSACGFPHPSSGWLQQDATLSNKDYMLPTFPPIHTLAVLDSLQRFQLKNLSQKLCSRPNTTTKFNFFGSWDIEFSQLCLEAWVHL